jgi:hypothetical protein
MAAPDPKGDYSHIRIRPPASLVRMPAEGRPRWDTFAIVGRAILPWVRFGDGFQPALAA